MSMNNTNLQVQKVSISSTAIVLECIDIDKIILAEDLYAELAEEPVISYSFDRATPGHMKYLIKIVASVKAKGPSFGKKLENLVGTFLTISDNFRVAA